MKKNIFIALLLLGLNCLAQVKQIESITSQLEYPLKSQSGFDRLKLIDTLLVKKLENNKEQYRYSYLLKYQKDAVQWALREGSQEDKVYAKLMLARMYGKLSQSLEAIKLGEELLGYEEQLLPNQMADVVAIVSDSYNKLEACNEVLALEPLAQKYFTVKNGHSIPGYTTAERLGTTYFKLGQYQKAILNFNKQAQTYLDIGNSKMSATMYRNMGQAYYKLNEYDLARKYYDTALTVIKLPAKNSTKSQENGISINYFEKTIQGNLGQINFQEGDYDKALKNFLAQLDAARINNDLGASQAISELYYNIAKTYYYKDDLNKAEEYLNKDLNNINELTETKTIIHLYELQGKILLKKDLGTEANRFFDRAQAISDSLQNQQRQRQNLIALAKYDVNLKDIELKTSQQQAAFSRTVATKQWIALIVIGISLLLITFFLVKSQRDKSTIALQKNTLTASLKEKEVLLKEIHHRVKNNLQVITGLLQLQSRKMSSPEMTKVLQDSQRHINSMALVHQMLYQQDDNALIPMQGYLEKLVSQLLYSLSGENFNTEVTVSNNIQLSIDKAIPLGLMLSELVTNTHKYAFDDDNGLVTVSLQELEGGYIFNYRDNGKGLPQDYKKKLKQTLGFRLIEMLAEEMDGITTIDGSDGVSVAVTFKDIEDV